jgi:3-oxoacyl-[acyl-carrier-protein] synthase-3
MNGREVYKFAVKATARSAAEAIARAGWHPTQLDLFIPHQANVRIIDASARALKLSEDRVFVNADMYGNTSSASIPIALCEAIEQGRVSPGSRLVLVGFGAGLSWAAMAIEWTAPVLAHEDGSCVPITN